MRGGGGYLRHARTRHGASVRGYTRRRFRCRSMPLQWRHLRFTVQRRWSPKEDGRYYSTSFRGSSISPCGALDLDLLDGGELVGGDVVDLDQDVPRVQARLRRDSPRFRRRLRQTGQASSPRMLPPLLVYSCPLPFSLSCFVRRAGVVQFMQMRWIRTAVPVVPFWRLADTTRRRTVCVPSARSSASMCTYG